MSKISVQGIIGFEDASCDPIIYLLFRKITLPTKILLLQ